MKIKELIKELKKFSQDKEVFLSNDSEGNEIKTVMQVAVTQDGEFVGEKWVRTKDFITIYPTDTVVNNNY